MQATSHHITIKWSPKIPTFAYVLIESLRLLHVFLELKKNGKKNTSPKLCNMHVCDMSYLLSQKVVSYKSRCGIFLTGKDRKDILYVITLSTGEKMGDLTHVRKKVQSCRWYTVFVVTFPSLWSSKKFVWSKKRQVLKALSTSSFGSTYLPLELGARADYVCVSGFNTRSWARRAAFCLDRVVRSMHRFVY